MASSWPSPWQCAGLGFGAAAAVLTLNVATQRLLSDGSGRSSKLAFFRRNRVPPAPPAPAPSPPRPSPEVRHEARGLVGEMEVPLRAETSEAMPALAPPSALVREAARKDSKLLSREDPDLRRSRMRVSRGELRPHAERVKQELESAFPEGGRKPVVVAVAGGSGSGKTTLATAIFEALGADHITFISHDNYYRDLSHLSHEERATQNFDHPDALETSLLRTHILALLRGEEVDIPTYDFANHTRRTGPGSTVRCAARPVILCEGILIFADDALCDLCDIKIFVDTDADTRFIRRLLRDVRDRGRSVSGVVDQYLGTVRPMHIKFVEPSKRKADIIVPVGLNSVALDLLIARLHIQVEQHQEDLAEIEADAPSF